MFGFKTSVTRKNWSILIAATVSALSTINVANAQLGVPTVANQGSQTPDWILQAQTGISAKEFQHASFAMRPIVGVAVNYFRVNDETHKTAFEELWYHNGKPLGIARDHQLEMAPGQNVAVQVLESPTAYDPEHKAAANTIMRLVLNILIKHDKISYVKVPDSSYWFISQELVNRKAQVVPSMESVPPQAKVVFQLQSEKSGQNQVVYFL
jgi:hypothetical protein